MKVLIIAGGQGTRLWPLSRSNRPKQLQALLSQKSLLQETAARMASAVQPNDIYIVVSDNFQLSEVKKQLPHIPGQNIVQEPGAKNTAAAICYGAAILAKKGFSEETMLVLAADHVIKNNEKLIVAAKLGEEFLTHNPQKLITFGIKPTYPETGYGYIKRGAEISSGVYSVQSYKEKPDKIAAETYTKNDTYLWNGGIFMWKIKTLLNHFEKYSPEHTVIMTAVQNDEDINTAYSKIPSIAFDYAISEKDPDLVVIPIDLEWTDIGHWKTVKDILQKNPGENVTEGRHIQFDTSNCLIVNRSDRIIATIGLDNLIIVDLPDALLICPADRAQDVRKIVAAIEAESETNLT
ncbi:MAG: sugar phosphate nucleotidyltransferase [Patescibacteria group bacterium]|jgi:mannose-1-phosphate guanylyltransferase